MLRLNNMYKLERMVLYQLSCVSTERNCKLIPLNYQTLRTLMPYDCTNCRHLIFAKRNIIQITVNSKVLNGVKMDITIVHS